MTTPNINTDYLNGRTQQTKTLSGTSPIEIAYGLIINPNSNNLGSTTVVTTSGPDGIVNPEGPGFAEGIEKRWDITPATQPGSDVDLEFFWSTAHQNGKATDNLLCWRLPTSASEWEVLSAVAFDLVDGNPVQPTPGFSGFTFSDGGNPLPVELVSFEGIASGNAVIVSWATASEFNSDYFTVERSRNGLEFSPIGRVNATGSSTRKQEYKLSDQQPYAGMNYYRLRQTDRDGSYENSQVIAVRFAQSGLNSVFHTPAQNYVISNWSLTRDEPVQLLLFDLTGRLWLQQQESAVSGTNSFTLDLSGLPTGAYRLELRNGQGERLGGAPVIRQ